MKYTQSLGSVFGKGSVHIWTLEVEEACNKFHAVVPVEVPLTIQNVKHVQCLVNRDLWSIISNVVSSKNWILGINELELLRNTWRWLRDDFWNNTKCVIEVRHSRVKEVDHNLEWTGLDCVLYLNLENLESVRNIWWVVLNILK